jgi:hypothetical protein
MLLKFTKLLFIAGILFVKSSYSSDYSEIDHSLENKKYYNSSNDSGVDGDLQNEDFHHRNLRYLVDSFYEHYDIYKEELNQQNIHFFENNYLDIVEYYFEYFTESKMTQWVADYFDRRLKSPLGIKKQINIYDAIHIATSVFFEAVSLSDECEYPSSDDEETWNKYAQEESWFAFVQNLRYISMDLSKKSKTGSTHVINESL